MMDSLTQWRPTYGNARTGPRGGLFSHDQTASGPCDVPDRHTE